MLIYWPNIICLAGIAKGEEEVEEKNIISAKISSILVAAKDATPIAMMLGYLPSLTNAMTIC
jgi:hypothetical protein